MNLKALHSSEKAVSAVSLFKGEGIIATLQILKNERLKEHITKIPAVLLCVQGSAIFENEKGERHELSPGDYVQIEPMVKHWVDAVEDSHLVLMK